LEKLVFDSDTIEISHDCGKFVCEGLYYSVLDYLLRSQISSRCIFVHVPILTENNLLAILEDFLLVIHEVKGSPVVPRQGLFDRLALS
jgi:pyroglutamyl-peptidase